MRSTTALILARKVRQAGLAPGFALTAAPCKERLDGTIG